MRLSSHGPAVAAVLVVLLAPVGPAMGATGAQAASPTANATQTANAAQTASATQTADRGVDSRAEVEAFVDAAMAEDLAEHRVSGATVSVVKDGELLFAEGYGYADRRNETPVVADRTLFRVGSVSKLFVWTAAAQQVEEGELDPNASVNRYLDRVEIPRRYGRPVTLEHLATHTAGFEDSYEGLAVESPDDRRPLGDALQDVPARVRPPGEVTSYSNYGAALAGHVVARQADTTFDSYVENRIFAPLNMTRSTFRQPVPADVPGRLSAGYRYRNGRFVRGEFETIGMPPAGSMSATSTDVAKFMLAHLQGGRYGDARLLSESATERMHRQHFTNHPALNGMGFGFYEESRNGVRIVGHGGDTELFHSGLWLFPERDLGVFVSYNSVGGVQARQEFFDSFVDRFFPAEERPATAPPVAADGGADDGVDDGRTASNPPLSTFTGAYRSTRLPYSDFTKIAGVGSDFRVGRAENATLVTSIPGQGTQRWVRTGPTVFEEVAGDDELAFRVEDGRATYAFFDSRPPVSFERIAVWETTLAQGGLFAAALVVFLTGLVGWPLAALWRRFRRWRRRQSGRERGPARANGSARGGTSANSPGRSRGDRRVGDGGATPTGGPRAARWLAGFAGLLAVGFVAGFLALVATSPNSIVYRPASLEALLAVPLAYAAAALGVVAFAVLAWTDRYWGVVGRVHYTLVAVAAVVLLWQLSYWKLLGYWL